MLLTMLVSIMQSFSSVVFSVFDDNDGIAETAVRSSGMEHFRSFVKLLFLLNGSGT